MKKDPLPADFVAYVKRLLMDLRTRSVKQIYRGVILRWGFWYDGVSDNKLPGYDTCPKPTERTKFPNGWSYQRFNAIAQELAKRPDLKGQSHFSRVDCGSGKPSSLITDH